MARQLTIVVDVDTGKATTAFRTLDKEIDKTGQTATRASGLVDQYGRAIQTSGQAAQQAGKHTTNLDATAQKLGGTMSVVTRLAGAFGVALSLAGVVQAIKHLIDYAERVHDIALASGMSTTAVQELGVAGKSVGIDMETMAQGVFQLSRRIAEGDVATRAALDFLGLSTERLRGLSPDQVFEQTAEALRHVDSEGTKARLGTDLYGRGVQQLMALINRGVPEAREFARETGLIASEDSIARVHEVGEQFSILVGWLKTGAVEGAGFWLRVLHPDTVLPAADLLTGRVGWGFRRPATEPVPAASTATDEMRAKVLAGEIAGLQARTRETVALISGQKNLAVANTEVAQTLTTDAQGWRNQITTWQQGHAALVPLTADQQLYVRLAHEQGLADQQIANDRKLALASVVAYLKILDEAAQKQKQYAEAVKAATAAQIPLSAQQEIDIQYYQKRGLAEGQIALLLHIGEGAIRSYSTAAAERNAVDDLWAKSVADLHVKTTALWEEIAKKQQAATNAQVLEQLTTYKEFHDKNADLALHGADLQVAQITRARDADIDAAKRRFGADSELARMTTAELTAYYQHQIDLANSTADTVEERLRAQGIFTQTELDKTAQIARQDFEAMRAKGTYTAEQLRAAWQQWYDAEQSARGMWVKGFLADLDGIAAAFQQLAQVSGGSMSDMARWLGMTISSMVLGAKATRTFGETLYGMEDGAIGTAQGIATLTVSVLQMAAAMEQATSSTSRWKNALSGAATGAAIGSEVNVPYGTIIGAGVGFLYGLFKHVDPYAEELKKRLDTTVTYAQWKLKELDANTSFDQLKASLVSTYGSLAEIDRWAKILGVDLPAAFTLGGTGGPGTAGLKGLQDTAKLFAETLAAFTDRLMAATDKGGLVTQDLLNFIRGTKDAGLEVKAVTDFLEKQRGLAVSGANALAAAVVPIAALAKEIDLAKAAADAIRDLTDAQASGARTLEGYVVQTDLGAIGVDGLRQAEEKAKIAAEKARSERDYRTGTAEAAESAEQSYAIAVDRRMQAEKDAAKVTADLAAKREERARAEARIAALGAEGPEAYARAGRLMVATFNLERAAGKSLLEALTDLAPGFDDLAKAAEQFHWTAEGAFGSLVHISDWARANPEQAGAVTALNNLAVGTANYGLMTQATFQDLAATATGQFRGMVGLEGKPGLSEAEALAVMQPTLQTLWMLQQRHPEYTLDEGTKRLLAEAEAAGIIGEAQMDAANRTASATDRTAAATEYMGELLYQIATRAPTGTAAAPPWIEEGAEREYHSGGVVEPWITRHGGAYVPGVWAGAQQFHAGGQVPIWALPYEGVVNHRGMRTLGRAGLDRLNAGGSFGGGSVNLPVRIVTINERVLVEVLLENLQEVKTAIAGRSG